MTLIHLPTVKLTPFPLTQTPNYMAAQEQPMKTSHPPHNTAEEAKMESTLTTKTVANGLERNVSQGNGPCDRP